MRVKKTLRAVIFVSRFGCSFSCAVVSFPPPPYRLNNLNNHFEQIDAFLPRYDIVAATEAGTLNAIPYTQYEMEEMPMEKCRG